MMHARLALYQAHLADGQQSACDALENNRCKQVGRLAAAMNNDDTREHKLGSDALITFRKNC